MAFWISLLLGNITTLILSANGHKQLVSGALKDFPAEVRGALHSIISSSMTALPASLGILFVFTTDLVLIKTTKLERGCLLCDVAEYGPSMMRLVVSLLETYLFSWAMKWLLTTVCYRRLSSRRGTESIKPGRAKRAFTKTGEKPRFARRGIAEGTFSRGIPDRRRCADSRSTRRAFTKHWLRCGGAVGEPLSEPHAKHLLAHHHPGARFPSSLRVCRFLAVFNSSVCSLYKSRSSIDRLQLGLL